MRLALAFAAGAAWTTVGAPLWLLPLLLTTYLASPIRASSGPARGPGFWAMAMVAGAVAAAAGPRDCPRPGPGTEARLRGHLLAAPRSGSAPLERSGGCGIVTVVLGDVAVPVGRPLALEGVWRQGVGRPWFRATNWSSDDAPGAGEGRLGGYSARWAVVRWRDALIDRMERLYGARAPTVAALTLARREGFDPDLRDAFARTGLAHLLAISGFHVGVVAGLIFVLLRLARLPRRSARLTAAAVTWTYVAVIGFPDAACRAAVIFTCLSVSTARGRPPAQWGALSTALLGLIALDPSRIASPGFQLSFAGAAGLVAWSRPWTLAIRRLTRGAVPDVVTMAVVAGCAATLATLPIVAWHFEQVSIVGVPATLVAGPLVAIALPGALVTLALDPLAPGVASFLAGGVEWLLAALEQGASALSAQPWVSVWTSRPTVVAGSLGVLLATRVARAPRIGAATRRALTASYVAIGVLGWPVLLSVQRRGTVELVLLDVGQGDAVALRAPDDRWLLIDAGPPTTVSDPGAHPVVRALRARGVRRLEALVLTHADLDHIGGAAAVLSSLAVGVVYDPGLPAGKDEFIDVLTTARERGVSWRTARRGLRLSLAGLDLEVLSPSDSLLETSPEANEASVVVRATFGSFDALLTGDAYKNVERALVADLGPGVEVLKVGHHGSDTSTDPELLDGIRPQVALVSVGRDNRYGHPRPEVLERLRVRGIELRRTDQEGTLSVTARRDGRFDVHAAGPGPSR